MAVQDSTHWRTVNDYAAFCRKPENADRRFELINGEIIEKVPTEEHGIIAIRIAGEIYIYLKLHPIARAGVEVNHQMPNDPYNSRLPDISVTLITDAPVVKHGAVPHMPDLAVEIKSPDQTLKGQREKAAYYLEHGCRLVWLIYPHKRIVEIYTADDIQIMTEEDTLDGGDVLPEFTLKISDIFAAL